MFISKTSHFIKKVLLKTKSTLKLTSTTSTSEEATHFVKFTIPNKSTINNKPMICSFAGEV